MQYNAQCENIIIHLCKVYNTMYNLKTKLKQFHYKQNKMSVEVVNY